MEATIEDQAAAVFALAPMANLEGIPGSVRYVRKSSQWVVLCAYESGAWSETHPTWTDYLGDVHGISVSTGYRWITTACRDRIENRAQAIAFICDTLRALSTSSGEHDSALSQMAVLAATLHDR